MDRRPAGTAGHSEAGLDVLVRTLRGALGLLDVLTEGIALYATDGTVVFSNAAAYRLIGAQRTGRRGGHFSEHIDASERERVQRQFDAVVSLMQTADFETGFAHADGSRVDVAVRLAPAFARDTVVGVYGIAADITAQAAVERQLLRSQQQFRSLFEHHPHPITMVGKNGLCERMNRAAEALTGFLNEELVSKPTWLIVTPDRAFDADTVRTKTARGESTSFQTTIVRKDGAIVDVEGVTIPTVVDGDVEGYFCAMRDITEKRRTRERLAVQSQRIHELYRVASSPGASTEEQVRRALALGMEQLGFEWAWVARVDGEGVTIVESVGADDRIQVGFEADYGSSFLRHAMDSGDIFFVEDLRQPPWDAVAHPGGRGWMSYLSVPLTVASRAYGALGFTSNAPHTALAQTDRDFIMAIVALTASAVERGLQQQRLDALAHYDGLTGLPNRVLLIDRLEQLIEAAKRHSRTFAVHFIDFDAFKSVNDAYGHAGGDKLLRAMAERLASAMRITDTLARLGGDEFIVLQPDAGHPDDAREFAERLAASFEAPFTTLGDPLTMTLSIGVSLYPGDGASADDVLAHADAALYHVKHSGRRGVRLYDAADRDGATHFRR
ncbi:MAG: diguanylate cyclase domain-containing protein [Candidatus Velthaea sp.]